MVGDESEMQTQRQRDPEDSEVDRVLPSGSEPRTGGQRARGPSLLRPSREIKGMRL